MTDDEKRFLIRWIIENVDAGMVPSDEGNTDGLIWNMVQYVLHDGTIERYRYDESHTRQIEDWKNGNLPGGR